MAHDDAIAWHRAATPAARAARERGIEAAAMKIDCLMGTYGRHALVRESLACFLQQSALSQATLLIYNQHPVALRFDHPRVRVVNEPPPPGNLRHIRARMHELADPSADLLHWWDDDDLYLPWHLEDCLRHIGNGVAWKPASCWVLTDDSRYERKAAMFDGSWVFRADHLRAAPLDTHLVYPDHPVTCQTIDAGGLVTSELGGRTYYVYRWSTGAQHLSAYGGVGTQPEHRVSVEWWRRRSRDTGDGRPLEPADLTGAWRHFLDGTRDQVEPETWELNRGQCETAAAPDPDRSRARP